MLLCTIARFKLNSLLRQLSSFAHLRKDLLLPDNHKAVAKAVQAERGSTTSQRLEVTWIECSMGHLLDLSFFHIFLGQWIRMQNGSNTTDNMQRPTRHVLHCLCL